MHTIIHMQNVLKKKKERKGKKKRGLQGTGKLLCWNTNWGNE